jgi:hypothetical protein
VDREEDEVAAFETTGETHLSADPDGTWLKKGRKSYFDYKAFVTTDSTHGASPSRYTGAVENSNRRMRRELPRNTDLRALTQEEFDEIILNHNLKPRKGLNWMSPLESFNENINLQNVAFQA